MDDRRQHRRLVIRLPIECSGPESSHDGVIRANTNNISAGGVYFEVDLTDGAAVPLPQAMIDVDLTVPPGEGHFPYQGRISAAAQVLRCDPLGDGSPQRLGIAARFCEPLRLEF
jgi:hypothetical protein